MKTIKPKLKTSYISRKEMSDMIETLVNVIKTLNAAPMNPCKIHQVLIDEAETLLKKVKDKNKS